MIPSESLQVVLATDCGSTTTKAILFEKVNGEWRATFRGEAPTTVEEPLSDVTIGARNAFRELEEISGRKILCEAEIPILARSPADPSNGVDLYVSTSSAGGGLQMIVLGVVGSMSTESAERAALGAGAIVMDAIACDDGREVHEQVDRIRHLRPDISLIAGGTDGGTLEHPLQLAETLLQADPRPRFGATLKLPVIYAANRDGREQARIILEKRFAFQAVDNLRPSLEVENLAPARDAIHEVFLEHVMSHAPGYAKLLRWSPVPILPTPAAFGTIVQNASKKLSKSILAVDIGGATTDVFSTLPEPGKPGEYRFYRTVSANLGMSYSVANVLLEAGTPSIQRWLPFEADLSTIADRLRNKMIRPTSIPHTLEDLLLEQAVCREALRLALEHHQRLATGLKGTKHGRSIGEFFRQADSEDFDMRHIDLIIGSGGVLSHAPDRRSAALMLVDAFQPVGVTELAVDSVFMMPHLGVLSSIHPDAAAEIFLRDCLIPLGSVVAPKGVFKRGKPACKIRGDLEGVAHWGDFVVLKTGDRQTVKVVVEPLSRTTDVGAGPGEPFERTVLCGPAGVIVDCRGRPLATFGDKRANLLASQAAHEALGIHFATSERTSVTNNPGEAR